MRRLAFLALCTALAGQDDPYRDTLQAGLRLYGDADLPGALRSFARAREIRPSDWRGHFWQAMTLLRQAAEQDDPARRDALALEARAMTGPLVKEAGVLFQDPLRFYLLGVCARTRGQAKDALGQFARAYQAPRHLFDRYREIDLFTGVRRSYGREILTAALDLILAGQFARADEILPVADQALPADDPARRDLERHRAAVDEALGRYDSAADRLTKCIDLSPDDPELREELRAGIALIRFRDNRYDEGVAALAKVDAASTSPEVLAARCARRRLEALRDPEGPAMDEALAFYRATMKGVPEGEVGRLVEEFGELVLARVAPASVEADAALLDETVALLEREIERHPECPRPYGLLQRIWQLRGDAENAERFGKLHAEKKEAYEKHPRFDRRGRPSCG